MTKRFSNKNKGIFIWFMLILLVIAGISYYWIQTERLPVYKKNASRWYNYLQELAQEEGMLDFSKEFPFEWDNVNIHYAFNDNNYSINRDAVAYIIESHRIFSDVASAITFWLNGEYVFSLIYPLGTVEFFDIDNQFIYAKTFSREEAVFKIKDGIDNTNVTQWRQLPHSE